MRGLKIIGRIHSGLVDRLKRRREFSTHHEILQLPVEYLRASCPQNFDSNGQRVDTSFDSLSGKPSISTSEQSVEVDACTLTESGSYRISWRDGHESTFSRRWVDQALENYKGNTGNTKIYWKGLDEEAIRSSETLSIDFDEMLEDEGMKAAVRSLYTHGILLVKNTPLDDKGSGIAAVAASVSGGSVKNSTSLLQHYRMGGRQTILDNGTDGPLRTLYGSIWSTTSTGQPEGVSTADSAYGSDALPLHTDMTYYKEPPGLQIFGMVQNSPDGGESVFGDGFYAAELLREESPDAFRTLCTVSRRYRSLDSSTGWHLEATGPVIAVDEHQRVTQIRHNDLDRLPDLPPPDDPSDFYAKLENAHQAWDHILGSDEFRLEIGLRPGETMLVANQRVFHGRRRFSGFRSVTGCYVSQDDLDSRFREEGFTVH